MANSSALTIISQAWDIMKVDASLGLPGLEEAGMLPVLNRANKEFIEFPYEANQSAWPFMKAEFGLTFVGDTTITSALTTASVTIPLTTVSGLPTAGAGVLYSQGLYDVIEWTGITSLTLTGVTGIGFAHAASEGFTLLYAVPSNFARTRPGRNSGDGIRVNGANYYYTGDFPRAWEFTLYDNGTDKFLWFPRGLSGYASVAYDRSATDLSSDSSLPVDVPIAYEDFLIYRLVEHGKRIMGKNMDELQEAQVKAKETLMRALQSRILGKRPTLVRGPMPEPIILDGKYIYIP